MCELLAMPWSLRIGAVRERLGQPARAPHAGLDLVDTPFALAKLALGDGVGGARRYVEAMRVPAKREVAEAIVDTPATRWLVKLPWRGVLVLAYHRVQGGSTETPFDPGVYSVTPSAFNTQLEILTRHFDVVSPEAIERNPNSPRRRVILTFDDGYRDNYELAFPILRRHGIPATFFLATGFLDDPRVPWWDELAWMVKQSRREGLAAGEWLQRGVALDGDRRAAIDELTRVYKSIRSDRTEAFLDYCAEAAGTGRCDAGSAADMWMTWEMAAELRDAGMTIGGHSVTHPVLGNSEPAAQTREIEGCGRRIGERLGVQMRFFAYPVGLPATFDETTQRILERVGVKLAFSLYGGYLRPGRLDPYDVPRASVGLGTGTRGFRAMLAFPRPFARW
jgi:peptidoglycan/xylan/chitin deacetylase (PgdA/CDA1 family)